MSVNQYQQVVQSKWSVGRQSSGQASEGCSCISPIAPTKLAVSKLKYLEFEIWIYKSDLHRFWIGKRCKENYFQNIIKIAV